MAAITLALASSLLWGLADYLGGVKSRSFPVPVVLACMYLTSLTVLAVVVGVRGEPPDPDALAAGLGSGLCGIAALIAFYRALAIGTMSIVAPIASTGVALPVLVGLATGDEPGLARSIGLALAVVGVLLASRQVSDAPGERRLQRQSVLLAIIAGLGFGMYLVLSEIAGRSDIGWALLLSRISATPFVVVVALIVLRRGGRAIRGRGLVAVAGIGLLDLAANACFTASTTIGELSTVAVAGSLYPVTTVLLAAALLGERVRGAQRVGIVVALCGVVLIAAGT